MINNDIKYYLVTAKCGHVGKGNYIEIEFPTYAKSAHDASQLVLTRPKVKKHLKNAITAIYEIDYEEYLKRLDSFKNNEYIKSHYKKEISTLDLIINRIDSPIIYKSSFKSRIERVNYIMKRNKIQEVLLSC